MNLAATARLTWRIFDVRVAIPDSIGNNYLLAIRAGIQSEPLTLKLTEETTSMISRQSSRPVAFRRDASAPKSRILRVAAMSAALLTMCFAILACSASPAPTPVVVEVDRIVEVEKPVIVEKQVIVEVERPSNEPNTLTVYSGRSQSLVDPILEEFELLTGIPVEVRYASTGEMAATLLEEGDRSPADVFFAQDPGGLGAVKSLFLTLPDDIYNRSAAWASDPDHKWVGISGRARTVVYSTENTSEDELPDSIWDFTDPMWKGRIGLPPTNGSFHVMVTAMRLDWGEAKTREWLEGIMANEPVFYAKNTPTVAAAGAGEIDVGFVNHYYLHRFLAEEGEGFGARNHYTSASDAGSLVMAAGAGILASTDAQPEAERLLKFLLGVTAQQYFATQTHEYPFNSAVQQSEHLPDLGDISERFDVDLGLLDDLAGTQKLLQEVGALP